MEDLTIQNLITEQKQRIPQILFCKGALVPYYKYEDMNSYYCWLEKAKRFLAINYPGDKHIEEFEKVSDEKIKPEQQKKLLAILEAFEKFPTVIPCTDKFSKKTQNIHEAINVTTNVNNSNSQSQNQQQSLAVELFLEAIKDDLTGRQIKELKSVVAEADNDFEKARPGIIEKLKSFGKDVASNIVANILTNPSIWAGL